MSIFCLFIASHTANLRFWSQSIVICQEVVQIFSAMVEIDQVDFPALFGLHNVSLLLADPENPSELFNSCVSVFKFRKFLKELGKQITVKAAWRIVLLLDWVQNTRQVFTAHFPRISTLLDSDASKSRLTQKMYGENSFSFFTLLSQMFALFSARKFIALSAIRRNTHRYWPQYFLSRFCFTF